MNEWQPIETAPTDDTRILGLDRVIGKVSITSSRGQRVKRYSLGGSGWKEVTVWKDESEVASDGYGWYGHDDWDPTHWMPLPDTDS
jgi:hypothetical protein